MAQIPSLAGVQGFGELGNMGMARNLGFKSSSSIKQELSKSSLSQGRLLFTEVFEETSTFLKDGEAILTGDTFNLAPPPPGSGLDGG